MEILDNETDRPSATARLISTLGGIAFVLGSIAAIVSLFGSLISYTAMESSGSPDAVQLANGLTSSLVGQFILFLMLVAGLICQMIAFFRYELRPVWIWRAMLICGILSIITSISPFSLVDLALGGILLIHVFSKSEFYQKSE
jgi:hypothetical protein